MSTRQEILSLLRPSRDDFVRGFLPPVIMIVIVELSKALHVPLSQIGPAFMAVIFLGTLVIAAMWAGLVPAWTACLVVAAYFVYSIARMPGMSPTNWPDTVAINLGSFLVIVTIIGLMRSRNMQLMGHLSQSNKQLVREQQTLQAVIDQLPIGVTILDADQLQVTSVNQQSVRLLGTSQDEQKLLKMSADSTELPLMKALLQRATVKDVERSVQRPDGTTAYLSVSAAPVFDSTGRPIAAVATYADSTLQHVTQDREREFIAIAAHEIKSPLTSIKVGLQIIARHANITSNADLSHRMQIVQRQVDRLITLITDLLEVGKIDSTDPGVSTKECRLKEIIQEVVETFQPITHQQIVIKGKCSRPVLIDEQRIKQVVTNLLANAAKHAAESQQVIIEMHQQRLQALVSVIDFGPGITHQQKKSIFERFSQAGPLKEHGMGVGLGLYISRSIIQQHQGKMWVKSRPGKGAAFNFTLPYASTLSPKH